MSDKLEFEAVVRNDDLDQFNDLDELIQSMRELEPVQEEKTKQTKEAKPKKKMEGFYELKPTIEGERRLSEIRRRRRLHGVEQKPAKTTKEVNYDPTEAEEMLDQIIDKVKANKYGKGMEIRSRTTIDELINAFLKTNPSSPLAATIAAVIKKLIKICKSYYEYDDHQFLDDDAYDEMVARWRARGFEEPTGYVPDKSRKTNIRYKKLHNNMDKAYRVHINDPVPIGVKESDSVEAWMIRCFKSLGLTSNSVIELEVSPKIDGVSGSGTISAKGRWEDPQTRGDDSDALDIRGMDGLELVDPKLVQQPFGIQFEIFITEADRLGASVYLEKDPPYVSCRHAASGVVNQLCTGDDNRLLQFVSLYPIEASGLEHLSYRDRMNYLDNFAVVPKDMIHRKILKGTMKKILLDLDELFQKWGDDREDHSFTYDGLVLTFVDDDYQRILGRQGRTNLYQIALKFNPASAVGKVAGIHLDFGKKGYRTLQVDLEHAIFLDGVRYDHVPVLSAGLFRELKLHLGDEVRVNRVGDVIPSITVEKNNHGEKIELPTVCPDCGHELDIRNQKLYCGNPQCVSNLAGRIEFFLKALGIDRYGENFARMVVETFDTRILDTDGRTVGYGDGVCIRGLRNLFELTPKEFKAKGINTKDTNQFLERLMAAMKKTADYEILGALGIPDLGKARAYDILKTFGGWDRFMSYFNTTDMDGLLKSAVGPGMGSKIFEALNTRDGWEELQEDIAGVRVHVTKFTDFNAKQVRLGHTGISKLPDDIMERIEKYHFTLVDGKNFDILITASMDSDSAKMVTAKKKDLPIMTLDGFRERYK